MLFPFLLVDVYMPEVVLSLTSDSVSVSNHDQDQAEVLQS